MIKVLDTKIEGGKIWLDVELERNTEILAKALYTQFEIEDIKKLAIREFLNNLVDKLTDSL